MSCAAPSTARVEVGTHPRLTPKTVLLLAVGLGLLAGYLDLGGIVFKRFAIHEEGSFRSPRDFPWTVPLSHVVLLMIPAGILALVCWRRPRLVSIRLGTWLLATLALWNALLRFPLYGTCSLILAFGIGLPLGDGASAFGFDLGRRWVRRTLGTLVVVWVILFAVTAGGQAIRESVAVAGLPEPAKGAPNVLLIVWDTVRATDLSLYGYPRETTPNLKRWAEKSVRFNRAMAPSPWTYPSHSSFFTGEWPLAIDAQWKYTLDTPGPTLAEFLASHGYQTAGFAANTNCCNYETGLDRGFIRFEDYALTPATMLARNYGGKWLLERIVGAVDFYQRKWIDLRSRGASEINEAFLGWESQRRSDRPFFAFLNYFDAHDPYIPPPGFRGRLGIGPKSSQDYQFLWDYIGTVKNELTQRELTLAHDAYNDCIAYLDDQLDRLLVELKGRGLLENTVVIVTSDHGEGFGEHGVCGHSYSVSLEEIAVPLVVLAPGVRANSVVQTPVSLRDLAATVADLTGLSEGSPFPGRSLAVHWRKSPGQSTTDQPTSPALSEQADKSAFAPRPEGQPGHQGFQFSLVTPDAYQYIRSGLGIEALYNLWADPWARVNLIGTPIGEKRIVECRRMMLDVLTENRGSSTVEKAYLEAFRKDLARLVDEADASQAAEPPEIDPVARSR